MAKKGRLRARRCLTDCTANIDLDGHTRNDLQIGLLEVACRLGPLFPKSGGRKQRSYRTGLPVRPCGGCMRRGLRARPQPLQRDVCRHAATPWRRPPQSARCNDMRRHKRQLRSRPVGRGKQAAALQGTILYSSGFLVTACSSLSFGSASSTKWCLVRNGWPFSGSTAEVSQQSP
jgi:hypothetical protein